MNPLQKPKNAKHYAKLLKSKEWRMNNLYWIKVKKGGRIKFRPNDAQQKFLKNRHGRDGILKARQRGFTTLIQLDMLDDCMFVPDTNAGVIAHNRDDAQAFFKDKIKFAYDNLAKHLRDRIPAANDAANELRFENGSVIRVGTSLRSGTFQYLHISEYGKICARYPDKAEEVRTGALPAVPTTGKVVIESTAEGRIGHFFELCDDGLKREQEGREPLELEYKIHFFPWWESDECRATPLAGMTEYWTAYFDDLAKIGIVTDAEQQSWYIQEAKAVGKNMKRENPATPQEAFEAAISGAYFSRQMADIRGKKQITRVPIEPGIPIHTFWDLGRDTTAIWFFQKVGFDYRFVDYFQNSGEDTEYYVNVLKTRMDGNRPYNYGDMHLPFDGTRKSMSSSKSPADILFENGYFVRIVQKTSDKALSIERCRQVIPICWFDKNRCDEGIKCLDNYRKEWDDKLGDWKKQPVHDGASHGADAFMTFTDGWYLDEEIEEDETVGMISQEGRNATTGY